MKEMSMRTAREPGEEIEMEKGNGGEGKEEGDGEEEHNDEPR